MVAGGGLALLGQVRTCRIARCGMVGTEGVEFSPGQGNRCKKCSSEEQRAYVKRRLALDPDFRRRETERSVVRNAVKRYGITKERAQELYRTSIACEICGEPPGRDGCSRLSIDHCHATKKIRGMLCGRCNTGIGIFAEDVDRLESAARYLEADFMIPAQQRCS